MTSIFEGKLIRLRAIEPSDWEIIHRWNQLDNESLRLSIGFPFPQSSGVMQAWAEQEARKNPENDNFNFHIETLDRVLVGAINSWNSDARSGLFWFGLRVAAEHRRKGYASEAIRLLLRYFFNERRYHKCVSGVVVINESSIRLHEQLGFKLEGRITQAFYTGGVYHDVFLFGMTGDEFNEVHKDSFAETN